MVLPNTLTIARIILTFVFIFFLFLKPFFFRYCAIIAFIVAVITDYYDGKIAREKKMITQFGQIMDPVADKILVLGAFIVFVDMDIVPAWMVIIIFLREVLISGVRICAMSKGVILSADRGGKHKTVSQFVTIFFILVYLAIRDTYTHYAPHTGVNIVFIGNILISCLMYITIAFTIISGISYLWKNRDLFAK